MEIQNGTLKWVANDELAEAPHFNVPDNVTHIGDCAFEWCKNLISVSFHDEVEEIGDTAFHRCENLITVVIPPRVREIKFCTFYFCKSLTTVVIPESVTMISDWAFDGCKSLNNIIINSIEGSDTYERIKALLPPDRQQFASGLMPPKAAVQGGDDRDTADDKASKTSKLNTFFQNTDPSKPKLNESGELEYASRP